MDKSDRENLGLVFDTWHYFRGNRNDELLATLSGDKILQVQLADAKKDMEGDDLFDDLMHYRKFPGEGDFDIAKVMEILNEIKGDNAVGPEIFSDAADESSHLEICKKIASGFELIRTQ